MTQYPKHLTGKERKNAPSDTEIRLARLLLRVCDQFDWNEPLDEELYNELKPVAEATLRRHRPNGPLPWEE